jgi:putative membrane protein
MYEVVEWIAAEVVNPRDAVAFLGTQGDPFDTQKDMALAMVGAALCWGTARTGGFLRRKGRTAQQLVTSLFGQPGR